ncbi:MAG: hypothetical protein HYX89_05810 [Chloroflexi bacterium]|nr:hypothetical protein [Chloroflexota bacterium]
MTLQAWRRDHRLQEVEFDLARTITRSFAGSPKCEVPVQVLFSQVLRIVRQFVETRVIVKEGYDKRDLFLNPYFGWAVETITGALQPDSGTGEAPEVPVYEAGKRECGSTADVDFWTSREVRDVAKSHLNAVVPDTKRWEQSAAYYMDSHENVICFTKNSGLGFAIPYMHNGQHHEYTPDYLVRLQDDGKEIGTLILEVKGYDPLAEVKAAAAQRWVAAVNNDGRYGRWHYVVVNDPTKTPTAVAEAIKRLTETATSPPPALIATHHL